MTIVTNTMTRYFPNNVREDLSNIITNIAPTDTPFMSNAGKAAPANNTFFEWQTDTLAAAVTTNARLDGDDYISTATARVATVRIGNYTQISDKIAMVSGTVEAVDKAGHGSLLAYELTKISAEIKRDMEATLTSDQVAVAGGTGTARKTAGLGGWIITNASVGAGAGAVPQMSSGAATTNLSGYPLTIAVAGTARAFTEDLHKARLQAVWTEGGDCSTVMVGPVNKMRASGFAGIATRFRDTSPGKQAQIIGAADVYVGDFGTVVFVPNRFQPESTAYYIDWDLVGVSYLRPFQTHVLAKTGDAEKRLLNVEYGLRVNQQKGLAALRDLTTS